MLRGFLRLGGVRAELVGDRGLGGVRSLRRFQCNVLHAPHVKQAVTWRPVSVIIRATGRACPMTSVTASLFVSATLFISCGSPFHPSRTDGHQHPARSHGGNVVFFVGTIATRVGKCPSARLEVARAEGADGRPVRVVTGPATIVTGQGGCSGLTVDARLEVEGDQTQDEVRANRILLISD